MDLLRGVLSGWVEMNFDDDVEESSDRSLRKSGQSLSDSGRSQRNDRNQRESHNCAMDDHQMNHIGRGVDLFWGDLERKNENIPDNKGLAGHDLVSTDTCLKEARRELKDCSQQAGYYI